MDPGFASAATTRSRPELDPLRLATVLALGSLAAGFAVLAGYCVLEAAASGMSLVDAYWQGRLPWMGIAEGLIVGGATATLLVGGLTTLIRGGWWRRAAVLPLVAVASLWWFMAVIDAGVSFAPCFDCPPRAIDPWAYAYSLPETAFAVLILPSLAMAALALTSAARSPVSRR
jgi:hypothetical protein